MYSTNNFVTGIQVSWLITENWRCTIKWGLIFSFFKLFPVFHVKFLTSVCKTHTFLAEVTLIKTLVEFIMSSFNLNLNLGEGWIGSNLKKPSLGGAKIFSRTTNCIHLIDYKRRHPNFLAVNLTFPYLLTSIPFLIDDLPKFKAVNQLTWQAQPSNLPLLKSLGSFQ